VRGNGLGRKDNSMSTDEFLDQYTAAVTALAAAETNVKVLEMRAKLLLLSDTVSKSKPKKKTKIQAFIEQNANQIEQCDIEFLSKPSRDTREVAEYREFKHRNEVSKLLRDGIFKPGVGDKPGKRMVDTLSVVGDLLTGNTEKQPG